MVFLDLQKDEYSMLDGEQASTFRDFFGRTRLSLSKQGNVENPNHKQGDANLLSTVLRDLTNDGLLTTGAIHCKAIAPTIADPPIENLIGLNKPSIRVQAGHAWRFLVSCALAASRLRVHHIGTIVAAVERRKATSSTRSPFDFDKARELVAVFNKLRAWFPRGYLCLFDSLALLEFLARYNVFPSWIFAVRPELWGAHCWVQEGCVVFNEDAEEAESYVPIMVI